VYLFLTVKLRRRVRWWWWWIRSLELFYGYGTNGTHTLTYITYARTVKREEERNEGRNPTFSLESFLALHVARTYVYRSNQKCRHT
jgi:hypothetical protein